MEKWKWYVYILVCDDDSYDVGMTWNPSVRFEQHLSKRGAAYTRSHGVKKLAYLEEHEDL
jgi:putative endonuclease